MKDDLVGSALDLIFWSEYPSDEIIPTEVHEELLDRGMDDSERMWEFLYEPEGRDLVARVAQWGTTQCPCCEGRQYHVLEGAQRTHVCADCTGLGFLWTRGGDPADTSGPPQALPLAPAEHP